MVLWGGLRPIASRVVFDVVSILGLVYATTSPSTAVVPNDKNNDNNGDNSSSNNNCNNKNDNPNATVSKRNNKWNGFSVLVSSFVFTVITAGNLTNRWTLTFPMIPLMALQGMRRIRVVQRTRCLLYLIQILSVVCILLAIKLCILFPAVELPPISDAPYHVGTINLHIPLLPIDQPHQGQEQQQQEHPLWLPIRILYPTLESPTAQWYLQPETAMEYCRESMRFGSPPPLQSFGWMLHTWRLTRTPTTPHAPLAPGTNRFPIVVYSHGLGGNADIYTYQTSSLAARGNVVVVLNHLDGSGPIVRTKCGKEIIFDYATPQLPYDQAELVRRNQTDRRVREVVAATEAVIRWNTPASEKEKGEDIGDVTTRTQDPQRHWVGRLETDHITVMGHSFGGVTALTAAKRRPDLYHAIVAHDPAIGWMPDDARRSLFAKSKLHGLEYSNLERVWEELGHDDDTIAAADGVVVEENNSSNNNNTEEDLTAHDKDTLILSSYQWRELDWGSSRLIEEMHQKGRLGPKDGVVHFGFVDQAHHNEFSDTCMLTPLWLARSVGVTGARNPLDTAQEIHERTVAFLNQTRSRHGISLNP